MRMLRRLIAVSLGVALLALPTLAGATGGTVVAYDSLPYPFPGNYPSLGGEAYSQDELGDHIALEPGTPRLLSGVEVGMSSWACETGSWTDGSCVTTPGATFDHPITLNIYAVDDSGPDPALGALLASKTATFTMPYRPSAAGGACGERWSDGVTCFNGLAFTITFDFSGDAITLPDEVILGVAYNTRSHGAVPIGVTGPYDSLNIGLGGAKPPSVGSNPDPGDVWWDTTWCSQYTDGCAGGTDTFRRDTGWSAYALPFRLLTVDPDADGDGVADGDDLCPGTTGPDAPDQLKRNRFAVDADGWFTDARGDSSGYSIADTYGCDEDQIIELMGLGSGHTRYGITTSALEQFIAAYGD